MRKIVLCLSLLVCSVLVVKSQVSFGESRLFNQGWLFMKGNDPSASKPDFDDKRWRKLDLPHDWSVEGPLSPNWASATGYLPGGIGWYRKAFERTPEMVDKRTSLYFEGVYNYGEVFINGHSLGVRPNGYISYLVDLTPYLLEGRNVVAVKVDHSKYADSRWYTGSGIYRDVYLIVANPVHIGQWGVFFTTPTVTDKLAKASVQTTVTNTTGILSAVTVEQSLTDVVGKEVATVSGKLSVPVTGSATLTQQLSLQRPQRWSLEQPYLYTLTTRILQNGMVIDKGIHRVGVRTLRFDSNKGFFLNEVSTKVKGLCLHHDAGCLGAAVPAEVWRERLKTLKDLGCNAIRTSHNPQAPILYDVCDELGLLVMNEAFDEWEYAKKKWVSGWNEGTPVFEGSFVFFEQWGETDLRDQVLRDRNHPSVMMWSIGNEVDYPNDPYSHPILNDEGIQQQHTQGYLPNQPNANRLGAIAKRLAAVVRANDPSRPVTAGLAGPVMSNETDYPGALDVVGYNYTERRYAQDHAKYPNRVLYGSENGQDIASWQVVTENDYIFGQFLWTGTDYLGEAYAWPSRGFSTGLLDLAGFKKPRGYFRESLWSTKPMVYIGTSASRSRNGQPSIDAIPVWNYREGQDVMVSCYTNCEQARLVLNGQPVATVLPRDAKTGVIQWTIPYKPGKLEVLGLNGGVEVARFNVQTSDRPDAITATASVSTVNKQRELMTSNGVKDIVASTSTVDKLRGVTEIVVQVVDAKGIPVYHGENGAC